MPKNTILMTGASSGIGYQASANLVQKGYKLIIPCRDTSTSAKTLHSLEQGISDKYFSSEDLLSPLLDLSDLDSIKSFSNELLSKYTHIDCLVLNAGLQYTGRSSPIRSAQGIELTIAVNHLSNVYLINKILPLLKFSKNPRIIITSSEVHNPLSPGGRIGEKACLGKLDGLAKGYDFDMLDGVSPFSADKAYKDSKLCNILFARELSRRLSIFADNIPVIAWAPGLVIPRTRSGFFRYSRKYNELGYLLFSLFARDIFRFSVTPQHAGELLANLCDDDLYKKEGFRFYSNKLVGPGLFKFEETEVSLEASNDNLAKKLWDLSCNVINVVSVI